MIIREMKMKKRICLLLAAVMLLAAAIHAWAEETPGIEDSPEASGETEEADEQNEEEPAA